MLDGDPKVLFEDLCRRGAEVLLENQVAVITGIALVTGRGRMA